jgi:hypothetical protein
MRDTIGRARELWLSHDDKPTCKQSLQVAPSIVTAYCAAWEQSFLADNPFDTVHLTDDLKKHVEAGLKAALKQASKQAEQKKWVGLSVDEDDECACVADRTHSREDFYEWAQSYRKAVEAKLKEMNEGTIR